MFENRYVHIDLLMRHLQIDYLNVMEISDFINKFLVTIVRGKVEFRWI